MRLRNRRRTKAELVVNAAVGAAILAAGMLVVVSLDLPLAEPIGMGAVGVSAALALVGGDLAANRVRDDER